MKIEIGVSKTPFDVHLELLCTCSPYFESLFQHRYDLVLADEVISFPTEDPQVFAQLNFWMYRGEGCIVLLEGKKVDFLTRLWILAGDFKMAKLQNSVMVVCKRKAETSPVGLMGVDTINYIYSNTLAQSPMRRLAVDIWVRSSSTECFEKRQEELPRDFLEDLCIEFIKGRESTIFPRSLPVFPEDRYSIPLSSGTDGNVDALLPREAVRIGSRKTKVPFSQAKGKSVTSAPVPASTEIALDEQEKMVEQLDGLEIHRQ